MRSSVTGTFAVELTNSARDRSICKLVTIAAADTWTWVAFSGTPGSGATAFAGDTSGTWLTDSGVGLRVGITLAAGSALQGTADAWSGADVMTTSAQTNLAATASATFDVTALCVFAGDDLPASSRVPLMMLPAERALRECQRYYSKTYDPGTAPGTTTTVGSLYTSENTSNYPIGQFTYREEMRAAPSCTLYNPATGGTGTWRTSGAQDIAATFADIGTRRAAITPSAPGSTQQSASGHCVADARLS